MVLLQRFCNKLGLRRLLQRSLPVPRRNADYPPSDLILALLYAIMAGLRRINKTDILPYNGTFLSLLGLPRFPDPSPLRRFLKRMPPKVIRPLVALHDHLRAKLFPLAKPRTTLTFDLDSVVLTIYGKLQYARVGYNPHKRGRRSYHPLICFEAHRQEFWHGSLRPGTTVSSTSLVPFLKLCLAKVPPPLARSRLRFRADSGCFGKRAVEFLDGLGCGYAIVAQQYSTIKARARGCRFHKLAQGWEIGAFRYQPLHGQRPHRFIVVRRPIPQDPVEAQQLTLFKDRKCRLLSDSALRLQPGAWAQEAVLAPGVSLRHAGYHAYGLPGLAGQTHQPRGPERRGAAPRLSLSGTVPSRTEEDRKTPASMNSPHLQGTPPRPFSIFKGWASENRNFTHY
jgi:Transposase DDE domain group 1